MTTRVLLISDTHLPVRARDLPAQVWDEVDSADLVIHAGDWVAEAALDALLERLGGDPSRLVGVGGNNDGPGLHARLPEVARVGVESLRLAVVHETGASTGREARCATRFGGPTTGLAADPDAATDVLIFGHSHIPWDTTAGNGLRLLTPGSPTDRRRQPFCSYQTMIVTGRDVTVRLHRLPLLR